MSNNTNLLLSGHNGQILAVKYNNFGIYLASAGVDRSIFLWSPQKHYQNIAVLKSHTNAITSLTWTYSDRLISGGADKNICNWDIQTQKIIRKYKGHNAIIHEVNCPKKTLQIIASVSDDNTARIWQQRSKQELNIFQTKYPLTSCCFSMNGDKLYLGGIDNQIKVYNVPEGKLQQTITGHQDTISCLQISHDGNYLMSNSFDETIKIWDIRSTVSHQKRLAKTLSGHLQGNQKALIKGSWSHDGLYICCGSIDKCVYIWDTTTKKIVQKLGGHSGTVNQTVMSYINQKSYLASCSNDKNIIVSQLPDIFL